MKEKDVFYQLSKEDIVSTLVDRFGYSEEDAEKEAEKAFDYLERKFEIEDWQTYLEATLDMYFLRKKLDCEKVV